MLLLSEARPSLVFIKSAWLCVQAPRPCLNLQQDRGPECLQATKLWAEPWPTNRVTLPLPGLADTNFRPVCTYERQWPQFSPTVFSWLSGFQGPFSATFASSPLPKLWLVDCLGGCENLWTTVFIPTLYYPMSVLIKQLTYHILYSAIYMHFSFTLHSEILKLQTHKASHGGINGSYLQWAGPSITWAHPHLGTTGSGGSPPGTVFRQLFPLPLHARVHSFRFCPNASFLENVVVRPSLTSPFSMAVSVPLPCVFFTAHIVTLFLSVLPLGCKLHLSMACLSHYFIISA